MMSSMWLKFMQNECETEKERKGIDMQKKKTIVNKKVVFTWLEQSSPFDATDVTELLVGDVWCIRMWRFNETFLSALYEHWLHPYCLVVRTFVFVADDSVLLPSSTNITFNGLFESSVSFLLWRNEWSKNIYINTDIWEFVSVCVSVWIRMNQQRFDYSKE